MLLEFERSVSAVCSDASSRISSRIFLEGQNIPLKSLPIGGEEGLDPILSFLPWAKEGFALDLRSERLMKQQIRDVLTVTTPKSLSDFADSLGIKLTSYVVKEEPRLFLFRHSLATLIFLTRSGKIFSDLGVENVWDLLSEIEVATREMILEIEPGVRKEKAQLAADFFAKGSELAKEFSKAV